MPLLRFATRRSALSAVLAALLFAVLCSASAVRGQAPECAPFDPAAEGVSLEDADLFFDALDTRGCLGGDRCEDPLCERFKEWEGRWEEPEEECARLGLEVASPSLCKVAAAAPLFEALRMRAADLPDGTPGVRSLRRQLAAWEEPLAKGDPFLLPGAVWQTDRLKLFACAEDGDPRVDCSPSDEVDAEPFLDEACRGPGATAERCSATFEGLAEVWTVARLQRRLLLDLQEEDRKALLRYVQGLDRRWTAFLSGARSQFPWEQLLNAELYRRRAEKPGFVEPPTRQWILVHPTPAYEYRDFDTNGLEEVLLVEIVGFYRWRWGADDRMHRAFGGSLIAAWNGGETGDDVSWGAVVHLPRNWSVGATVSDVEGKNETSVLLSVDLAKLVLRGTKFRERLIGQRIGGL